MAYNDPGKVLVAILILGMSSAAFAAEEKPLMSGADANMLAGTCSGCHGTRGNSAGPATPSIGGISPVYFEEIMQDFKSGKAPSTIMGRIARGHSDKEIKALADYFGKQPFVRAEQPFDESLANKGAKLHDKYCEKCHGDGGSSVEDDAGILLGQLTPYLHYTLSDFKVGDRIMAKKMKQGVQRLIKREGNAGFEALLNFYARGTWDQ